MKKFKYLKKVIFFLTCIFISSSYASPLPIGINLELSIQKTKFNADDKITLKTTLTNTSANPITFLKWNTPIEEKFYSDLFEIRNENGKRIKYIGKLVKRPPVKPSDYITIKSYESLTTLHSLPKGYDLSEVGRYTITYSAINNTKTKFIQSNKLSFQVVEQRTKQLLQKQVNYSSCNASEISALNKAIPQAINIANGSLAALTNTAIEQRATALRYKVWFGSYTSVRYSTAVNHFSSIKNALDNEKITFSCDCVESQAIAYVYPSLPYNIHLCPTYWNLDISGTDSQSGTIIHELSHFTVVADTDDIVYGKEGSKSLATQFPDSALKNADNHEYFAENMPALPMTSNNNYYEPNNSSNTAKEITLNSSQLHSINYNNDEDWVKFTLAESSSLQLKTSGQAGFDTRIWLFYGENLTQVGYNDDINDAKGNNYSFLSYTCSNPLTAGIYYLKVDNYYLDQTIPEYEISLQNVKTCTNEAFIPVLMNFFLE